MKGGKGGGGKGFSITWTAEMMTSGTNDKLVIFNVYLEQLQKKKRLMTQRYTQKYYR